VSQYRQRLKEDAQKYETYLHLQRTRMEELRKK
jgi:hypothetical protein